MKNKCLALPSAVRVIATIAAMSSPQGGRRTVLRTAREGMRRQSVHMDLRRPALRGDLPIKMPINICARCGRSCTSMNVMAHRGRASGGLVDVEGRRKPLTQGGDTGSNPVGAAQCACSGARSDFCDRPKRRLPIKIALQQPGSVLTLSSVP